jgi:N-acetylglucosaminyl-diphospho-decaprenol L-rhamnosyltransferase
MRSKQIRDFVVDVVIVNWNSGELLRQCITALDQCTMAHEAHVIVVDNASSDGSAENLCARNIAITVLRHDTNLGFAAGCNAGAKHGKAVFIIFLNPDVILNDRSLEQTIRYFDHELNSDVGIVGIQLVDRQGQIQRRCARRPSRWSLLLHSIFLDRVVPSVVPPHFIVEWDHKDSRDVDQVMGACLAIRRALFERLGGFDERYFLYYEDVDLCAAAWDAGARTTYYTGAVATHLGGGTTSAIPIKRTFYLIRSRVIFAAKHFGLTLAGVVALLSVSVEAPVRLLATIAKGLGRKSS